MDCVRAEGLELARDVRARPERQADLRIARAGEAAKALRGDDAHHVAERGQGFGRALECRHDAVGLRRPGIACERDPHAASATTGAAGRSRACAVAGLRRSDSSPHSLTARAVLYSTNSTVLS